jgi:hypothetical protein
VSTTRRISWTEFRDRINSKNYPFQEFDVNGSYQLVTTDGLLQYETFIHTDGDMASEKTEYEADYQPFANQSFVPRTSEGLPTSSINRIPFGYTIYPTGVSDDPVAGTYGSGVDLLLDKDNKTADCCFLNNWYAIGAEAGWSGDTVPRDYVTATLIAGATTGTNGSGFDFTKVATGLGFNLYVPTAPGAGDWDLDLDAKHTGKEFLNVTPVPVAGNTGFFDYDKLTKRVKVNTGGTGGYNLYDVNLPLFSLGRKLWGVNGGGEKSFIVEGVIGKLLYANWFIRFELTIWDESNRTGNEPYVGMNVVTGAKANI